ncbi:FG-GAP-like repeat-containing protein [Kitasatospora sp. GP82]|uniref:FG-GAP-like repeat-containing protein n=1 Tax=Kitasatospora sp. GP82 TaxID=3035089 RepID=UPI00247594A5|nr:FG-GAP-like repeat-containing protein [Kitasatospora sp. GP82]MDH6126048.1 hypothetical protein [Kitasatospora sp. GP82]
MITPVQVATTAPQAGEELRAAGYGRTKTEWVPNLLHSSVFTADTVQGSALNLAAKSAGAAVCKGDTGGPAFREKNGQVELAALNSRSWQGGCLGESETRTGALDVRLDDVNGWIQQTRLTTKAKYTTRLVTTADINHDGRTDVVAVLGDGTLHAFYGRADGTLEYGRELWNDGSWGGMTQIIGGDFNGDGYGDIAALWPDGTLHLYTGTADGKLNPAVPMWPNAGWKGMPHIARIKADASGRDGLLAIWEDGSLFAYATGPNGVLTGSKRDMWRDKSWGSMTILATGDFNGDGRDDVVTAYKGSLLLYTGNAKGTFDDARPFWYDNSWDGMQTVVGGDINGDGKSDLIGLYGVSANPSNPSTTPSLRWYQGDGNGKLSDGRTMWPAGS